MRTLFLPMMIALAISIPGLHAQEIGPEQREGEVTVTLKELDLEEAIREFRDFQKRLDEYRKDVTEGQMIATDIATSIANLRRTATPENNHNEQAVLEAVSDYVEGVLARKVDLVDFLQSQRYRITYYANMMAQSVEPQDVALLFGTRTQNEEAIRRQTLEVAGLGREIREFVDQLAASNEFSLTTFRPRGGITAANRRKLTQLQFRYQNAKSASDFAKARLRFVEQSTRAADRDGGRGKLDIDLILAQMFGALDRIRLQMSADLLHLEGYLSQFERSTRTQDIFGAFEQLVALQGGIDGPSQGLPSLLEWLSDSSERRLSLDSRDLLPGDGPGFFPRSHELLKEAYKSAGGDLR